MQDLGTVIAEGDVFEGDAAVYDRRDRIGGVLFLGCVIYLGQPYGRDPRLAQVGKYASQSAKRPCQRAVI